MTGTRGDRDFRLYLLASVFLGLGACVNAAAFNNYLRDNYALDIARRTFLEFPRELPGFLVSLLIGMLAALGDRRIAALAAAIAGVGMFAMGWIPPVYGMMVLAVFVLSSGQHLNMPLSHAIGMDFAAKGSEGRILGRIQSSSTVALVSGSAILLALFKYASLGYRAAFTAGSLFFLCAAVCIYLMEPAKRHSSAPRFVARREYSRFYVLSILFGARKQLFITFGPWLIVDFFAQPVSTMTLLFFIVSILGIFTKPAIGRLTDRFGPARILAAESFATIAICLVYAYSPELLPAGIAVVAVSICYVFDQATDAVTMTRAIYVKRLVRDPGDISPTLSLGVSIEHIVSMTLPMLGGLVWKSSGNTGYRWVFLGGALVAAVNYLVVRGIPKAAAISGSASPASSPQGTMNVKSPM